MAAITCKCGNRLSNTEIPNDVEYHVYSDREWNNITMADTIETISFPKPQYEVWKCAVCSRLYIFNSDGKVIKIYKLEEDY
jgi:hypothetical protein